jgi:hypothetical protein
MSPTELKIKQPIPGLWTIFHPRFGTWKWAFESRKAALEAFPEAAMSRRNLFIDNKALTLNLKRHTARQVSRNSIIDIEL